MRLGDLDEHARDLAEASLAWMDPWWDAEAGLLWNPPGAFEDVFREPKAAHMIRESGWYALGLLLRGGPGDDARALRTTKAIVRHQYDEPGTAWHGTWPRFPEEPAPSGQARVWIDYDPNWRQFVGTALALATRLSPEAFAPDVRAGIDAALRRAVEGEPPDRVPPNYSNVALMRAWLEGDVAARLGEGGLADRAVEYARRIVERFRRHGAFEEYNSPTYYGIDLYALALWRSHTDLADLSAWGTAIEDTLWRDFARFYHPRLGNLCGPYSRAYGMDMQRYVANMSMWLWAGLGRSHAPFPAIDGELLHGHDFAKGPAIAALGARVPPDCTPDLTEFRGTRLVRQRISDDPDRVATAWLGDRAMVGADSNGAGWNAWGQYHPATVHWTDDANLGSIRIVRRAPLHARASERRLSFDAEPHRRHGPQPTSIVITHPRIDEAAFEARKWHLPGLTVGVATDAQATGRGRTAGQVELAYTGAGPSHRFELQLNG